MDKELFSYKGIKSVLIKLAILTLIQGAVIIAQAYYLSAAISSLFGEICLLLSEISLLFFFWRL